MAYKKGESRIARVLFPDCIDDYIEADAPVRLFDSFVDSLDMQELNFVRATPKETGTPGYDPRDLLKMYIYGYFYQVRSSRKLARECKCNIEMMWLLGKLTPDFRTISDFRKDNKEAIAKIFKEFNKFCLKLKLFSRSYISIDGSKFKAVNAKDNNFTLNKLDDRIKRLDEHIAIYMKELEEIDLEEDRKLSKDELTNKLKTSKERKEKYEIMRDALEKNGKSQISLIDTDARLMKQSEGFCVGYNVQTAVDAGSHLIAGYNVTNSPTDHGQLTEIASEVKDDFDVEILEVTADKGYEDNADHANALAAGIIPNVIQKNEKSEEEVSFSYHEAKISEETLASSNPTDIKTCLEAGVVPNVYKGILLDPQIADVRKRSAEIQDSQVLKMSAEEMLEKAKEGYFVRDPERNLVYCPQGCTLRPKSEKKNGNVRFCNRLECRRCKSKCTKSNFKEVDFQKDTLIKPAPSCANPAVPPKTSRAEKLEVVGRVVRYKLRIDENKTNNRKCLSEHPFGTIKRTLNQYYFLLKGFAKVKAEMGLFCLSYNLRRAINLVGVQKLIAAFA